MTKRHTLSCLLSNKYALLGAVTVLLALLLAVLVTLLSTLFSITSASPTFLAFILCMLVLFALAQTILRRLLERTAQTPIAAGWRRLPDLSRALTTATESDHILLSVTDVLYQTLLAEHVGIWLYNEQNNVLTLSHYEGLRPSPELVELPLDQEIGQFQMPRSVASLPESALRQGLLEAQVISISPMICRDQLLGILAIGPSRHAIPDDNDATQLLEWVTTQATQAIRSLQLATELRETITNLQLAYHQTIDVQEEERRKLAAELHDDILGRLTTMSLTLRNSRKQLVSDPAQVGEWLEAIEKETKAVNLRLREITQGLHPSVLIDLGMISALQAYVDSLARQPLPPSAPKVIALTAQGFGNHRIPNSKLERDLYHITRQALDNAVAHAHADHVYIHLRWSEEAISITVQDTGRGMKDRPARLMGQNGHLGLLSMHERGRAWGGHITIDSVAGSGCTVRAYVPIDQPSQAPHYLQAFTQHLARVEAA